MILMQCANRLMALGFLANEACSPSHEYGINSCYLSTQNEDAIVNGLISASFMVIQDFTVAGIVVWAWKLKGKHRRFEQDGLAADIHCREQRKHSIYRKSSGRGHILGLTSMEAGMHYGESSSESSRRAAARRKRGRDNETMQACWSAACVTEHACAQLACFHASRISMG